VAQGDTGVATPLALIGQVDGPQELLFGKIAAVAADDSGTIYVADGLSSNVRAYNIAGSHLGTLGREGQGPGEFRYLRDLVLDAEQNLHVRGAFRVSVFGKSQGRPFADSLRRTWAIRGLDNPPNTRSKADGSRYYLPSYTYRDFLIRGFFMLCSMRSATHRTLYSCHLFRTLKFQGEPRTPSTSAEMELALKVSTGRRSKRHRAGTSQGMGRSWLRRATSISS
jgi:hypothetical protein